MSTADGSSHASTIATLAAVVVAAIWVLYTHRTPFVLTQRPDPAGELFVNVAVGVALGGIVGALVMGDVAFAGVFGIAAFGMLALGWAKNQND